MKKIFLCLFISSFILSFSTVINEAWSDDKYSAKNTNNCNAYSAEYKSNTSEDNDKEKQYFLKIVENADYYSKSMPKATFVVSIRSREGGQLLSEINIPYHCTQGTVHCYLDIGDNSEGQLEVLPLSKDFTPIFSYKKYLPSAIVVPNASNVFQKMDWSAYKNINFTSEKKIFPDGNIPNVWIFNKCI